MGLCTKNVAPLRLNKHLLLLNGLTSLHLGSQGAKGFRVGLRGQAVAACFAEGREDLFNDPVLKGFRRGQIRPHDETVHVGFGDDVDLDRWKRCCVFSST